MAYKETIDKVIKLSAPFTECGLLAETEVNELKEIKELITENSIRIPLLFTLQETAKIFRTTTKTIHVWVREGKLKKLIISPKTVLIPEDSICDFIENCKIRNFN